MSSDINERFIINFEGTQFETGNYNRLSNKPSINGVELKGDLTSEDLNIKSTEYTAGEGILIDDYDISVDSDVVVLKGELPTKTSELINDSGFQNEEEVKNLINTDLSNYYSKDETEGLLDSKQDELISGLNIKTINNQPILGSGNIDIESGSEYTGGTGIDISNYEISVDSTVAFKSDIPTAVSELANDRNFATKTEVENAIDELQPFDIKAWNIGSTELQNTVRISDDDTHTGSYYKNAIYFQTVKNGEDMRVTMAVDTAEESDDITTILPTKSYVDGQLETKADAMDIPTKTSDLTNDSGFITSESVPTSVSQLTNDSGYQTQAQVETIVTNDLTNYYAKDEVDTLLATKQNTLTKADILSILGYEEQTLAITDDSNVTTTRKILVEKAPTPTHWVDEDVTIQFDNTSLNSINVATSILETQPNKIRVAFTNVEFAGDSVAPPSDWTAELSKTTGTFVYNGGAWDYAFAFYVDQVSCIVRTNDGTIVTGTFTAHITIDIVE